MIRYGCNTEGRLDVDDHGSKCTSCLGKFQVFWREIGLDRRRRIKEEQNDDRRDR